MIKLGFPEEAKFCSLLRNWYRAEDEAGISAWERIKMNIARRDFLLSKVTLSKFPPYKSRVLGMPRGMFEGFLQSIDTSLQSSAIVIEGKHNAHSFSSLPNETFFGQV